MKYNGVIQRKLALLDDRILRLKNYVEGMTKSRFIGDWAARSVAERTLQVSAEIVIDIAERIIALENAGPVAGAAAAIEKLHQLGVLSSPDPYRSIVRLRNLIVHEYEEIEPDLLFDIIQNHLDDFRKFRDEIDIAGGG